MKFPSAWVAILIFSGAAIAQEQPAVTEAFFPQQLSAKDLLVHCSASSLTDHGRQRQRYCAGFVSGVEEAVRLLMGTSGEREFHVCVPGKASARQFREAYIRYAGRRGTNLDRPAALVVVEALAKAYPCGG